MLVRLATGLVLAPVVTGLILYGPKAAMLAVLGAAAARCTVELLRMYPAIRPRDRIAAAFFAGCIALSPLLGADFVWTVFGLSVVCYLSLVLFRTEDVALASQRAALGLLSFGYIALLIAALVGLFVQPQMPTATATGFAAGPYDVGRGALLTVFLVVFLGDTGAFFAGKFLGKNKLFELVSPKKTVEGAIGGLVASIGGGVLSAWLLLPMFSVIEGALVGAACGAVGQIGDLVESLFKRATNTKDSGNLLPGHGGLLDRVDGVLFAAPVLHAWLAFR